MKFPKRFKIHEAAGRALQLRHIGLVAFDHASFAVVPILLETERPGADLPRLEREEDWLQLEPLPPKAFQVATAGTKGEGLVRRLETSVAARAGDGKPWVHHERPEPPEDEQALTDVLSRVGSQMHLPPVAGRREVHVSLDAEALVRLAHAIGAEEGVVNLRFHVEEATGRACLDRGFIEVRVPNGGYGVLMVVAS